MKLYVHNKTGTRYLTTVAPTRNALANIIGSNWFIMDGNTYNVNQVFAEEDDTKSTTSGLVIGGLIGLIGGPIGVIGGGLIGGLIGNDSDGKDAQKVKIFNNSNVLI